MTRPEEKTTERAKPDKSKEAKFQRALDALSVTATAYFAEDDTETAIAIKKHHAELTKLLEG